MDSYLLPLIRASLTSLQVLRSSLSLLLTLLQNLPSNLHTEPLLMDSLPRLFVLAYVMPRCIPNEEEMEVIVLAEKLWKCWKDHSDSQLFMTVTREVKGLLRGFLTNTDIRPQYVARNLVICLSQSILDLLQY